MAAANSRSSVRASSTLFCRRETSSRLLARAFSEMQAPGPGGVERDLCEEPVTFRGPGLPFAPRNPTDDREGTSCRLLARTFSEMQAPGPGGVERGPLRGTADFPG